MTSIFFLLLHGQGIQTRVSSSQAQCTPEAIAAIVPGLLLAVQPLLIRLNVALQLAEMAQLYACLALRDTPGINGVACISSGPRHCSQLSFHTAQPRPPP